MAQSVTSEQILDDDTSALRSNQLPLGLDLVQKCKIISCAKDMTSQGDQSVTGNQWFLYGCMFACMIV